jgi:hypothetical protein
MDPRAQIEELFESLGIPRASLSAALGLILAARDAIAEGILVCEEIRDVNNLLLCIESAAQELRKRLPAAMPTDSNKNALSAGFGEKPLSTPERSPAPLF